MFPYFHFSAEQNTHTFLFEILSSFWVIKFFLNLCFFFCLNYCLLEIFAWILGFYDLMQKRVFLALIARSTNWNSCLFLCLRYHVFFLFVSHLLCYDFFFNSFKSCFFLIHTHRFQTLSCVCLIKSCRRRSWLVFFSFFIPFQSYNVLQIK